MKKLVSLLLCLFLLFGCCSACEKEPEQEPEEAVETGPVTLTVVTEEIEGVAGLNRDFTDALFGAVGNFRMTHRDIKVDLEILPTDKEERQIRLQKLRTDLMAGKGPDVFLLPSGMVRGGGGLRDPLFANVEMAMRNLYFTDLSEYYDADEDLKREELQQDIMDAGVLDGARYVLPLGFNMPVVCYVPDRLEGAGLTEEELRAPLGEFLGAALESGNVYNEWFASVLPDTTLCLFQPLFDFETGRLLLDREAVYAVSRQKWQLQKEGAEYDWPARHTLNLESYMESKRWKFLLQANSVAFVLEELSDAADMLGMGKNEDVDVKVTPMRTMGGEVAAEVTYYGAVSANSNYPAEAYEFLRTFLSAGVQHQKGLGGAPTRLKNSDTAWPVRVAGSVNTKWSARRSAASHSDTDKELHLALGRIELSDEDLPFLFEKIDVVRFQLPIAQNSERGSWLSGESGVDSVIEQLEYYIAES